MLFSSNKRLVITALIAVVTGMSLDAGARPNIQANTKRTVYDNGKFRTTASCRPAVASIDLDINNVRARLMTGGDMWWNIGISEAGYEVPKGSRKHSLFAGSIWVGGYDPQGQLKVAAQTYRQDGNDYWPGPLEDNDDVTAATCAEWDRFWKINKSDIISFRDMFDRVGEGGIASAVEGQTRYDAIKEWPATGNADAKGISGTALSQLITSSRSYAPFVDVDGDGVYNWRKGDYPGVPTGAEKELPGDQYIWWVFNDRGNVKQQTQTEAIGLEVQASAFAFSTKDVLNDATFYRYRMINRSNLSLDSAYVATWTDADLGYAFDDYIGCDTSRSLGILYNGTSIDGSGQINSYGTQVPMVGIDFFEGPKRKVTASDGTDSFEVLGMSGFYYYNNDFSPIGNPSNGQHIYGYMTGTTRGGLRFTYDWDGVPGSRSTATTAGRPITQFVYPGDPSNNTQWSECACNNLVGDRRFVHSSGPFQLEAGAENTITIAAIWVSDAGGCPNTSFTKIRAASDLAQELYESNFQVIRGPDAPRMVVREMDRKLVFYLLNDDPRSNNYQEKYGYDTAARYRVASAKSRNFEDSLYKFEGYRVFQLKHAQIQPADIFNENGEVNTDVAIEVFQTDIRNGVGTVRNWIRQDLGDGNDSTWTSVVKVEGRDSGLVHSFALEFDAFATGADKRFVNYRNYYFVAIAYAFNDFAAIRDTATGKVVPSFSGSTRESAANTQDVPYLEGDKAPGGENLTVVAAMPNPANGSMGTVLNSDYGTGVIIKRIEGIGNGGLSLQLSKASEEEALAGPDYQAVHAVYDAGQGPVEVKVVDPLNVKPGKWELFIKGVENGERGLIDTSAKWELVYNGGADVIYSERSLAVENDQILEKYGLSVTVKQVVRPGENQADRNGYITSSVVFADPGKTWLSGVPDGEGRAYNNWIRSGKNMESNDEDGNPPPCNWNDTRVPGGGAGGTMFMDSVGQFYENLFASNSLLKGTWAPYALAADENRASCGFGVIYNGSATLSGLNNIRSVDIVMTSDKSKWTECVVIEMQDDPSLAEGRAPKFTPRRHASWTGEVDANGNPIYDNTKTGKSWFPGYAIDQETGMRLNIAFSEDSWLKGYNGGDMIWNPTSDFMSEMGTPIFGGKHYVYILNTKYDKGEELYQVLSSTNPFVPSRRIPTMMMWVGLPLVNSNFELKSIQEGIIPTETRLRIRVDRPYASYAPDSTIPARNNRLPLYSFSTDDLAPSTLDDAENPYAKDKQKLLDRIKVVPNPYYAYTGYEINRLDTRVRITNLPRRATINVYSLDGSLIRRIEKDNPNVSYIDWDIRNAKGLPIASGMYLIHVNADGIGETVLRWFGAMRPIDVTNY